MKWGFFIHSNHEWEFSFTIHTTIYKTSTGIIF